VIVREGEAVNDDRMTALSEALEEGSRAESLKAPRPEVTWK
jgi:hypothetical protein